MTARPAMQIRCSSLPRLALCPGSLRAQEILADTPSAAADSGTAIHAALSEIVTAYALTSPEAVADAAQLEAAARAFDTRETSILAWFSKIVQASVDRAGGAVTVRHEVPHVSGLPATPDAPEVVLTGHSDLEVLTNDGRLHVFEYKTGLLSQATSDRHLQGKAYAVAAYDDAGRKMEVVLHIVAAGNDRGEQHTLTRYGVSEIAEARLEIADVINAVRAVDAPRRPSDEACRYCRAAGTFRCPESCRLIETFQTSVARMTDPVAIFWTLSPEQRGETVDRALLVAGILDRVLAAAKEAIRQEPGAIAGWTVGTGATVREVADVAGAQRILESRVGLSPDAFQACCKASLTAIRDAHHAHLTAQAKARGQKAPTKKAAAEELLAMLAPCIETKQRAGSLEKVATAETH